MPVIKSAKKKLRKDKKRTLANNKWRSLLDTIVKKAKKSPSVKTVSQAFAFVDKSAKKHLIHKNKAARIKSSLSKLLPKTAKTVTPKTKAKKKTPTKSPKK